MLTCVIHVYPCKLWCQGSWSTLQLTEVRMKLSHALPQFRGAYSVTWEQLFGLWKGPLIWFCPKTANSSTLSIKAHGGSIGNGRGPKPRKGNFGCSNAGTDSRSGRGNSAWRPAPNTPSSSFKFSALTASHAHMYQKAAIPPQEKRKLLWSYGALRSIPLRMQFGPLSLLPWTTTKLAPS